MQFKWVFLFFVLFFLVLFAESVGCCYDGVVMNKELRDKILAVCEQKIAAKGEGVGVSFYAFFENKNTDPELLMEAATWWIQTHKLDHFEKAVKIRDMVAREV